METRNVTCVGLALSLQGFAQKVFRSRSAYYAVAGFSQAEGAEFERCVSDLKAAVNAACESNTSLGNSISVGEPMVYTPGHPNMSVDYIGRAVEHICYYVLVESISSKVADSGLLPYEGDLIAIMLEDIIRVLQTPIIPYHRIITETPAGESLIPPAEETEEVKEDESWSEN